MTKHEAPPFRMIIEGGKLVPATPYDAERLDSYRRGTKVNVRLTEEKDRVLVRKWWAVLGLIVKQCDVPWQNKEQASEAIKLALGIVNLTKTVGGAFMQYPKSLTELEDPELQEAVEQMMALVARITGVDPETLRKEIAHVGEDNPQSSDTPADDTGSDGKSPSPESTVAAELSEPADEAAEEEGAPETDPDKPADGQQAAPSSEPISGMKRMLCEELVENMLRDAFSEPAIERPAKLDKLRDVFLEAQNLGDLPDFVTLCHETARRVIGKASERDRAKEYLMAKIPAGGA